MFFGGCPRRCWSLARGVGALAELAGKRGPRRNLKSSLCCVLQLGTTSELRRDRFGQDSSARKCQAALCGGALSRLSVTRDSKRLPFRSKMKGCSVPVAHPGH